MAVESVGLAASIAGLMSLGLQATGGVVAYVDALKNREEELASIKRQNDAMVAAIGAIKASSSRFQNRQHDTALAHSIQSCEAVETLLAELANCDTSTWRRRFNSKKKKLSYKFDRPKVQQVTQRLHHANDILQLTLTGLELVSNASASNRDILTEIDTKSRDHAFNLLLLRSEVATAVTSITDVRNQFPVLRDKMDIAVRSALPQSTITASQIQEFNYTTEAVVSRSHESTQLQFQQHREKLERIENLQQMTLSAVRAMSQPAKLRDMCDSAQASKQHSSRIPPLDRPRQIEEDPPGTVHNARIASITGRYCICPSPYRFATEKEVRWNRLNLGTKLEARCHWPSCPMSHTGSKKRRAINLGYSGSAYILQAAIEITFAMISGAGGFSISPSITYYPRVNGQSDTAFRILKLIGECFQVCQLSNKEAFMVASLKSLTRLFDEKRAFPTAVTNESNTLMHEAASAVRI
ncbi:hypothetical protein PG984_003049 [Apiospora sp. TS-2023a]